MKGLISVKLTCLPVPANVKLIYVDPGAEPD
jgi:hypothetical protein